MMLILLNLHQLNKKGDLKMSAIQNRMEFLFLYEAKDCNPNGDPLDENRPRTDPETGVATVTDVRIKRTVRDYLYEVKGLEILIRDTEDAEGYLKDGKGRCDDFLTAANVTKDDTITSMVSKVQQTILEKCIDARLFGATLPVEFGKKASSIKLTGPVQISGFNRSLHRVSPQVVQGTAAFASKKGATQKSFREDHLLPYALISVYGVVNEIAARTTELSEDDVNLLMEGLWRGTESLISRSKMGHQPLFLMKVEYKDGHRIGDLSGRIRLVSEKEDTTIRSVEDYQVEVTHLLNALEKAGPDCVSAIDVKQDDRLIFRDEDYEGNFETLVEDKRGMGVNLLRLG
jgi:CRISPR-associated protein Csh2